MKVISVFGARPEANKMALVVKALAGYVGIDALAVVIDGHPDMILVARQGSPLAIGRGTAQADGTAEMAVVSDSLALAPFARRVTYLQDGDSGGRSRYMIVSVSKSARRLCASIAKLVVSTIKRVKKSRRTQTC